MVELLMTPPTLNNGNGSLSYLIAIKMYSLKKLILTPPNYGQA